MKHSDRSMQMSMMCMRRMCMFSVCDLVDTPAA